MTTTEASEPGTGAPQYIRRRIRVPCGVTRISRSVSSIAAAATGLALAIGAAVVPVSASAQASVASVTVTPATSAIALGSTLQLTATSRDSEGKRWIRLTDWTSSNPSVAAVSVMGLVTALDTGSATITAAAGGRSGTATVTVTATATPSTTATTSTIPTSPTTGFTPGDILDDASFETGWDGFMDGGSGTPTRLTRDATQRYGTGAWSVRKVMTAGDPRDETSSMHYAFYYRNGQNGYVSPRHGVDRLYSRFWIRVDRTFNGTILKLQMFQVDGFDKFAEFAFFQNYLVFGYVREWGGGNIRIAPLSALNDGRWHSIESDVQFNGNTDAGGDYISTAIWFDGVNVSMAAPRVVGGTGRVGLGRWVNGRINAGSRAPANVGRRIGVWSGPNVLNARNPVAGNLWMDRISISTLGRVGP